MKRTPKILLVAYLATSILFAKDVFLVDTSGSLNKEDTRKEIKKLVKKYLESSNDVIAFSNKTYSVFHENDLKFKGGTELSKALAKATSYSFVILLTDGVPDSIALTIKEAKNLKSNGTKICSVFISSNKTAVPNVLKTISDKVFSTNQIEKVLELCNSRVKEKLIGSTALKIQIDEHKYDF